MVSTTTNISTSTSFKSAILHPNETPRQHGVKGVYYGGEWLDIEDCQGVFDINSSHCSVLDRRVVFAVTGFLPMVSTTF